MLDRLRRDEAGFGLLELVIALTVLNVGILATIAALNSGAVALQRASRISTASALADAQMELFRALRYDSIGLYDVATADGDATYRDDPARGYGVRTMVAVASCAGTTFPVECLPIQSVSGAASPDGRAYRVDTYVEAQTPTASSRPLKVVTVVVRDGTNLAKALVRAQSTFDQSTGT
ncbi:MAG TPA: prepilin-type N-terminal cleavage/methylation domain-containing protein [Gaiellaceae bacterium]|nr:prepilin-type N-terminal cleavage/methylation domain-containing protein [Gaiellaceae bacterium]